MYCHTGYCTVGAINHVASVAVQFRDADANNVIVWEPIGRFDSSLMKHVDRWAEMIVRAGIGHFVRRTSAMCQRTAPHVCSPELPAAENRILILVTAAAFFLI